MAANTLYALVYPVLSGYFLAIGAFAGAMAQRPFSALVLGLMFVGFVALAVLVWFVTKKLQVTVFFLVLEMFPVGMTVVLNILGGIA